VGLTGWFPTFTVAAIQDDFHSRLHSIKQDTQDFQDKKIILGGLHGKRSR
jgi:hypothetical protein